MPGPKVRRQDCIHIEFMKEASLCGAHCSCVLLQGEPGFGMKGEKGDTGAPGPQVSDTDLSSL